MNSSALTLAVVIALILAAANTPHTASALVVSPAKDSNPLPVQNNFYFESHGRDDLREWRAAIKKGAQYLKVDFNFQPASVCKGMKRAVPDANGEFPNGCFVLSHFVDPLQPNYNTTEDIITFIQDPANTELLLAYQPIIIQMCLKNRPERLCATNASTNATKGAKEWIGLMDAFYSKANPLITGPLKGSVKFVFDELSSHGDNCTIDRWVGWDSTWVGGPLPFAYVKNNWTDKFQMPNMHYSDFVWPLMIENHFYKFKDSPYAFIGWEPSDEWSLDVFFAMFLNFPEYTHSPGIISAYNGDPAMWHVMTAPQTGRFAHESFGPLYQKTPVSTFISKENLLLTFSFGQLFPTQISFGAHTRGANGKFTIQQIGTVLGGAPLNGNFSVLGASLRSVASSVVASNTTTGTTSYALVIGGSSGCVVSSTIQVTHNPVSIVFGAFRPNCDAMHQSTTLQTALNLTMTIKATPTGEKGFNVAFVVRTATEVVLVPFSFIGDNMKAIDDGAVTVTYVAPDTAIDPHGLDVDFVGRPGLNTTVVAWSITHSFGMRNVFASIVENKAPFPASNGEWFHLGTGKNPSVALHGDGKRVSISYGWSFCFNSELTDDSIIWEYGHMVCDQNSVKYYEITPEPINSYVYGTVQDLRHAISKTMSANDGQTSILGYANTCDDTLYHGVFDIGYDAHLLLIDSDELADTFVAPGGLIGVATLVSLESESVSTCGNPLAHNGKVIVDSFPLMGQYGGGASKGKSTQRDH